MNTAKIFTNGRSQAVRLPKDCRFESEEVYVRKYDEMVILIPKKNHWHMLINSLDKFSHDFMEERAQPIVQKKRSF